MFRRLRLPILFDFIEMRAFRDLINRGFKIAVQVPTWDNGEARSVSRANKNLESKNKKMMKRKKPDALIF